MRGGIHAPFCLQRLARSLCLLALHNRAAKPAREWGAPGPLLARKLNSTSLPGSSVRFTLSLASAVVTLPGASSVISGSKTSCGRGRGVQGVMRYVWGRKQGAAVRCKLSSTAARSVP